MGEELQGPTEPGPSEVSSLKGDLNLGWMMVSQCPAMHRQGIPESETPAEDGSGPNPEPSP